MTIAIASVHGWITLSTDQALTTIAPRIRDLRLQHEQLQNRKYKLESYLSDRKVELADLKRVMGYVENLRSILDKGTLAERRSFIRSFVRSIKVTGDNAKLSYMMPVPPEWLTGEKVRVLYSVRYGGAGVSIGRTFEMVFSLHI